MIGEAGFEGAVTVTERMIQDRGKEVGADIVLYSSQYLGSEQVTLPFTQFNPGQVSTTFNSGTVQANSFGPYGSATGTANYSGTSTTTTPGTFSTNFVPVTLQKYAHNATFWRKRGEVVFGIIPTDIPQPLRVKYGRNAGIYVAIVIDDSPAFRANILVGDVITFVDDRAVVTAATSAGVFSQFTGKTAVVTVLRDGAEKKIPVTFGG